MMRKSLILALSVCLLTTFLSAADEGARDTKATRRIESAATVLDEIQGARYGKGVASCRTPKGWSAPAFFTIGGGSFGLQIGGEAVDLVMLIMNKDGMDNLLSSNFKLGADASAAAGPVGRHASAN